MPNLGPAEIILVVGVIVLLFGARKLPEFARSLGRARGEFKKGIQEGDEAKPEPAEAQPEKAEEAK